MSRPPKNCKKPVFLIFNIFLTDASSQDFIGLKKMSIWRHFLYICLKNRFPRLGFKNLDIFVNDFYIFWGVFLSYNFHEAFCNILGYFHTKKVMQRKINKRIKKILK